MIKTAIANRDVIVLTFGRPLDLTKTPILSVFKVNHGQIGLDGYDYGSQNTIILYPSGLIGADDVLTVSYEPEGDSQDLSLIVPTGSSQAIQERAKVPPIWEYPVNNLTPKSESKTHYDLAPKYPSKNNTNPNTATIDDFIATYGVMEAIQISNIHDGSATEVNRLRIERAIEDANSLIDAYVKQAPGAGKLLVSSSRRRTAMIIARYYLDSVRRRQDVTDDYERCIKELDILVNPSLGGITDDDELAINNGGIMRSWRVCQKYDHFGKGFAGYYSDPAYDYPPDIRFVNSCKWRKGSKGGTNDYIMETGEGDIRVTPGG